MRRPPAFQAILAALAGLLVLAVFGYAMFVRTLEQRVLQALGPRAHVGAIHYGYPTLELRDVAITTAGAPYAWPASEELHVARIAFDATLADLWAAHRGAPLRVMQATIEDGSLSVLRLPGHLVLLPALREQARAKAAGATGGDSEASAGDPTRYPTPGPPSGVPAPAQRPVTMILEHVHMEHVSVDLFDATLDAARPRHLVFSDGRADVGHVALPAVAQPMTLDLQASLVGAGEPGRVAIRGSLAPGVHDADLSISLKNGDVAQLQPYLLRHGEAGVKSGRLDVQVDARVAQGAVHAPGHLTISNLQFDDDAGTFAGVERRAVLAALTKNGRLDVHFTLDGRLDDPKFKLDEDLPGRIAIGIGAVVGVSVKGAVETLGDALKGLLGGGAPPVRKP